MFRGPSKALALLVFCAVPVAWGQSQRVVLVDAVHPGVSPSILEDLRQAITIAANLELAEPSPVTRALSAPPQDTPTDDALPSLSAADDAIARFDYDQALLQLFRAERPLLDRLPTTAIRKALADINFRLGLVYVGQGDLERARASMRAVHFLTPNVQLDPARYPPEVIGEFERARPGADDATLAISSSVPKAAIFIDGLPLARSPAEAQIPAGVHYVLVAAPGFRPSGRRIVSASGSVQRLNIALAPVPLAIQASNLRRSLRMRTVATETDDLAAATKVLEWSRADVVVILRGAATAPTAIPVRRSGALRTSTLPAQQQRLLSDISPLAVATTRGWYERPWLWVAVGGAVAAVITVAIVSSGDEMRPTGGFCFPPQC